MTHVGLPGLPPGHPRRMFPGPETQAPSPQRWECALCITEAKAWQTAHANEIETATVLAEQQRTPFIENYLPEQLRDAWPHISDAATIDTVNGRTCAVCAEHVP